MKEIELIIKISKELYEAYKGKPPMLGDAGMDMIAQSIANGTPLPKHHGRLLVLDERLVEQNLVSLNATTSFCNKWLSEVGISNSVVKIIPATKGESE